MTMDHHHDESESVRVEFSPVEGQQLMALLKELIDQTDAGPDLELLLALHEKLADANVLAAWLRENVALDMQPAEVSRFVETLGARLAGDGGRHPEACAALAALLGKLSERPASDSHRSPV